MALLEHDILQRLLDIGIRADADFLRGVIQLVSDDGLLPIEASTEATFMHILNRPIAHTCLPSLPPECNTFHKQILSGLYFLEVTACIDIMSPSEERKSKSKNSKRMFKLSMTDGKQTVIGIEDIMIPTLSNLKRFGCKVLVKDVPMRRGVLLLSPSNLLVLGGSSTSSIQDVTQEISSIQLGSSLPPLGDIVHASESVDDRMLIDDEFVHPVNAIDTEGPVLVTDDMIETASNHLSIQLQHVVSAQSSSPIRLSPTEEIAASIQKSVPTLDPFTLYSVDSLSSIVSHELVSYPSNFHLQKIRLVAGIGSLGKLSYSTQCYHMNVTFVPPDVAIEHFKKIKLWEDSVEEVERPSLPNCPLITARICPTLVEFLLQMTNKELAHVLGSGDKQVRRAARARVGDMEDALMQFSNITFDLQLQDFDTILAQFQTVAPNSGGSQDGVGTQAPSSSQIDFVAEQLIACVVQTESGKKVLTLVSLPKSSHHHI